jgi:hypothetical protein
MGKWDSKKKKTVLFSRKNRDIHDKEEKIETATI